MNNNKGEELPEGILKDSESSTLPTSYNVIGEPLANCIPVLKCRRAIRGPDGREQSLEHNRRNIWMKQFKEKQTINALNDKNVDLENKLFRTERDLVDLKEQSKLDAEKAKQDVAAANSEVEELKKKNVDQQKLMDKFRDATLKQFEKMEKKVQDLEKEKTTTYQSLTKVQDELIKVKEEFQLKVENLLLQIEQLTLALDTISTSRESQKTTILLQKDTNSRISPDSDEDFEESMVMGGTTRADGRSLFFKTNIFEDSIPAQSPTDAASARSAEEAQEDLQNDTKIPAADVETEPETFINQSVMMGGATTMFGKSAFLPRQSMFQKTMAMELSGDCVTPPSQFSNGRAMSFDKSVKMAGTTVYMKPGDLNLPEDSPETEPAPKLLPPPPPRYMKKRLSFFDPPAVTATSSKSTQPVISVQRVSRKYRPTIGEPNNLPSFIEGNNEDPFSCTLDATGFLQPLGVSTPIRSSHAGETSPPVIRHRREVEIDFEESMCIEGPMSPAAIRRWDEFKKRNGYLSDIAEASRESNTSGKTQSSVRSHSSRGPK